MSSAPNTRLKLSFELDLSVPDEMAQLDPTRLEAALAQLLGTTVFKGMPTVSGKQLAKGAVAIVAHRYALQAESLLAAQLDAEMVKQIAPHLNNEEVAVLCKRAAAKAPADPAALPAYIRRQAMAMASGYRLVPCAVTALNTAEKAVEMGGQLNITNGAILIEEAHRKTRLKGDQGAVRVTVAGIALQAALSGHTLSGPVLEVDVKALGAHRDALQGLLSAQSA